MARLDPLIKVRKHTVDEKQRVLAELFRQQDELKEFRLKLLVDLAREQALVEADPTNLDTRIWLNQFANGVHRRCEEIDALMHKLETRIMIATDDVRTAFAELKKIEITDRERKKRDKKKIDDAAARELDDIGLDNFRRQGEE